MKRWLLILAAALLLCTSGCARSAPSAEELRQRATADFTSTARVEYGELEARLTLDRRDGVCTVELTEPEQVRGLQFVFGGELVTVTYGDVSFELDPESLPVQAAAGAMVTAVNNALQPFGVEVTAAEDHVELSGDAEAGRFLLRLDPVTGCYLSVELPDSGFSAEFENFEFLPAAG